MSDLPPDRSEVLAEQRDPRSRQLHLLSICECVHHIQEEDRSVHEAVAAARPALIAFLEEAEIRFRDGGRLIYLGAGTSGRLGVLDASEIPPTFQLPSERVVGIIAGGDASLRRSSEGMEDDPLGAVPALEELHLDENDCLVGIAAGGTTPYVRGALSWCSELASPPLTALISCSPCEAPAGCSYLICAPTGPEIVTGSTRMKAGTATKLLLNTISTTLMIRSGRVYGDLMIDLKASNDKLCDRAARIIQTISGLERHAAFALLNQAEGSVKEALIMHRHRCDLEEARRLLHAHDEHLAQLLD